jgi:hypothetical protein
MHLFAIARGQNKQSGIRAYRNAQFCVQHTVNRIIFKIDCFTKFMVKMCETQCLLHGFVQVRQLQNIMVYILNYNVYGKNVVQIGSRSTLLHSLCNCEIFLSDAV